MNSTNPTSTNKNPSDKANAEDTKRYKGRSFLLKLFLFMLFIVITISLIFVIQNLFENIFYFILRLIGKKGATPITWEEFFIMAIRIGYYLVVVVLLGLFEYRYIVCRDGCKRSSLLGYPVEVRGKKYYVIENKLEIIPKKEEHKLNSINDIFESIVQRKDISPRKQREILEVVRNVISLDINNCNLKNFEGLEKFPNLKYLSLANNQISDLSFLVKAPLEHPELKLILTNLIFLDLSDNGDLPLEQLNLVLPKLSNLKYLYLNNCGLKEIPNLSENEHIISLKLRNNQIGEIANLERCNRLRYLDLSGNKIHKIEGLNRLYELIVLHLENNNIEKIEGLEFNIKLRMSFFDGNPLVIDPRLSKSIIKVSLGQRIVKYCQKNKGKIILSQLEELKNFIEFRGRKMYSITDMTPELQGNIRESMPECYKETLKLINKRIKWLKKFFSDENKQIRWQNKVQINRIKKFDLWIKAFTEQISGAIKNPIYFIFFLIIANLFGYWLIHIFIFIAHLLQPLSLLTLSDQFWLHFIIMSVIAPLGTWYFMRLVKKINKNNENNENNER
ncbi:MAG: leucine-rich repeat domain-containing protein [Promethearchaeota archaeon]